MRSGGRSHSRLGSPRRHSAAHHLGSDLEGDLGCSEQKLKAKALDLLSRRDHSEAELKNKLITCGGKAEDVMFLLERLRQANLLDDLRFARGFVSFRIAKVWGYHRYRQELEARGVSSEVIVEALTELSSDRQAGKLRAFIQKELASGRDPQKIAAALFRRGFSGGEVWSEFKELSAEFSEEL